MAEKYDSYTKLVSHFEGTDGDVAYSDPVAGAYTNTAAYDTYTKLCSHFDGTDADVAYTDPIGGAYTNTAAYDTYTKLCSHFDGSDAAVAYTDPIAGAYTFSGSAQLDTAQKKFGTASLYIKPVASTSIDDEDMASITDWTDADDGGTSSQATFDSKDCMKLDSGTATHAAIRTQDIGNFGSRTVFSMSVYCDAVGTQANGDAGRFSAYDGAHHFRVSFASDGLMFYSDSTTTAEVGTNLVVQDTWQEWTFDVDWTNQLVDVYLDGILKATALDFSAYDDTGTADGMVNLACFGITTANRIMYVDWFKAGATFGSYVTMADSAEWYFDGDFSIDFWVCFSALPSATETRMAILSQYVDSTHHWMIAMYENAGTYNVTLRVNGSGVASCPYISLSTNTWYHVYVGYVASTTTYYTAINGDVDADVSATTMPDLAADLQVGTYASGSYTLDGWIDELRISHGVCRWTADFTVPPHAYGQVALCSSQKKFGATSAYFDGCGASLSLADSANWNFAGSDFTVDFWARFTSLPAASNHVMIVSQYVSGASRFFISLYNSAGTYRWYLDGGSTSTISFYKTATMAVDTWYHMAFVRTGDNFKIFQNGVQLSTDYTNSNDMPDVGAILTVGYYNSTDPYRLNGYLDELRISNGVARWTDTFTPPTHAYGQVVICSDQKKYGSTSAYFDGAGSYITLGDSANWDFADGDFTVDFWARFPVITGTTHNLIGQYESTYKCWYIRAFESGGNTKLDFYAGTAAGNYQAVYAGNATIAVNTWYHIAIVRNGTSLKAYLNGVDIGWTASTAISTNTIIDYASVLYVGARNTTAIANCYLDEVRISKGIARWTAAFTPPTGAITGVIAEETITTASSIASKAVTRSRAETITGSDSYSRIWSIGKILSESVTLTDTLSRAAQLSRLFVENSTLSESWAKVMDRLLSESILLSEDIKKAYATEKAENVTISDIRNMLLARLFSDSMALTGIIAKDTVRTFPTESVTMSDRLQEWLRKSDKPTTWSSVSTGSSIWTQVSTSGNIWMNVGT